MTMENLFASARRGPSPTGSPSGPAGVLLFDEDFDLPPAPPPPPEPEVIEPVFTAAELAAAREEAARDARDAALLEADAAARAVAGRALESIARETTAAREAAVAVAEQAAEALARLLMDCFAAAFPALSARHGADEASAVLRHVLPVLHREPRITVRVNPHAAAATEAEIASLDPDLAARVRIVPTDAMAADDVRVSWENGDATRDTAALWDRIEDILAPAGLLSPRQTPPDRTAPARTAPAPAPPVPTPKEHALVD